MHNEMAKNGSPIQGGIRPRPPTRLLPQPVNRLQVRFLVPLCSGGHIRVRASGPPGATNSGKMPSRQPGETRSGKSERLHLLQVTRAAKLRRPVWFITPVILRGCGLNRPIQERWVLVGWLRADRNVTESRGTGEHMNGIWL